MMLKSIFLVLLALCLHYVPAAHAQIAEAEQIRFANPGIQKWYAGWYISLQGDTVPGFIYLSNQVDNQLQLKYATENPPVSPVKTIVPAAAKGFRVKDRVYQSLLTETTKNAEPMFFRRMESGRINLYAWYAIPINGMMQEGNKKRIVTANDEKFHEQVFYLQTGDELPFRVPDSEHFAADMSRLLADDEVLAGRIAQEMKSYRATDILNIVQQYNKWYSDHH